MRCYQLDSLTRRRLIARAAKTFLGVGVWPWLTGGSAGGRVLAGEVESPRAAPRDPTAAAPAESVIYLYMSGGMSHIDSFDPKPGTDVQGPVANLQTNVPGIAVTEFFPRIAKQIDKLAVINSVSSTQGAHPQGRYFMHTSYFLRGTIVHPELGAYVSHLLPKRNSLLPSNIKIGTGSADLGGGFLESRHAALPIGDPETGLQNSQLPDGIEEARFTRRLARLRQMNSQFQQRYDIKKVRAYSAMYEDAVKLMKSDDLQAFDIRLEQQTTREKYGASTFGQGCLLARRLIEHGIRFVEVELSGWDTHTDNFDRVAENGAVLDQSLSALLEDLADRGRLPSTLVVVATEFGRTPEIVAERNNGRNHYPKAFSCLLAGGGTLGGAKYGKTDDEGREVVDDPVTIPDFNATIAHAIGLPLKQEILSPSGRPFTVAADGQPVLKLFG